jgi:guanylate kinase
MSAPAGTGKDTVIRLLKESGCPLYFPVTYTTRPARANERQNVDYHFVSNDAFDRLETEGHLLEWAIYNGNRYGSPREEVERMLQAGKDVLLKIEVQGARSVKKRFPEAVTIFLMPPSLEAAAQRMAQRQTETADEQERRATIGAAELAAASEFDYRVVNHDGRLPEVVAELRAIVEGTRHRLPFQQG